MLSIAFTLVEGESLSLIRFLLSKGGAIYPTHASKGDAAAAVTGTLAAAPTTRAMTAAAAQAIAAIVVDLILDFTASRAA